MKGSTRGILINTYASSSIPSKSIQYEHTSHQPEYSILLLPHFMTLSVIPLDIRNVLGHLPRRDTLLIQLVQLRRGPTSGFGAEKDSADAKDEPQSGEKPSGIVSISSAFEA